MGRGNPCATLQLVGEAPGKDEDEIGEAFVGRAGRTLDMCIWKAELGEDFFIHNLLKCRPPDNRDPEMHEVQCCRIWLRKHLEAHPALVIVAMGRYSVGFFRNYDWKTIKKMRVGKEIKKPFKALDGTVVVPTYHPAYLLRNPEAVPGFIASLRLAKKLHNELKARS